MINFKCIKRIETEDIIEIIDQKKGKKKVKLTELKEVILERYGVFMEVEALKRLVKRIFDVDEKEALQSLYSSKTATAKKITSDILDNLDPNHSNACLYCGIGEIDQMDHFFPKEHFPEFSILHKNLIPICGRCNEIKGEKIPGENGVDFLHSIYDILPLEDYLKCEINFDHNIPKVDFFIVNKYQSKIIGKHFEHLKLANRIEKKSVQYFLQIKALYEKFGEKYVQEEIERDYIKISHFHSQYFWKAILIRRMIDSEFLKNIKV